MYVKRDLQRSFAQTSAQSRPILIKSISLVLSSFEYLNGWSFHSVFSQLQPFFNHSCGERFSFRLSQNFLCSNLCPLPPFFPLHTSEKSLDPSSQHIPVVGSNKLFPETLQAEQIQVCVFFCTSWDLVPTCLGGHLLNVLQHVSVFHILKSMKSLENICLPRLWIDILGELVRFILNVGYTFLAWSAKVIYL